MRDSHGTYDGSKPEPPYECPECADLTAKLQAAEAENVKAYEIGLAHSQAERLRLSDQVKNLQDELAMYKLHTTAEFIDALHQRRVIPESGGHIESTDCWCGPTVEEHPGGTLIIHNQTH